MPYEISQQAANNLLKPEIVNPINYNRAFQKGFTYDGVHYSQAELIEMYGEHLEQMTVQDINFDFRFDNPTFSD